MKIKSYFAESMKAAFDQARREMGPEAMIVESRRSPEESRHMGEYEVVAALAPPEEAESAVAAETAPAPAPPDGARFAGELSEMRRQLELMRKSIARNLTGALTPRWPGMAPELKEAYAALVAADVDAELARDIVETVASRETSRRGDVLLAGIGAEMARRLKVNPALGRPGAGRRVVALVGPPGAGKTVTLVKLAVTYGLTGRRPMQLLSMDNWRVGGADQLRSYAAILGVGFQALETVGGLAQALEEHRAKDLILIDTPGMTAREVAGATDLAHLFHSRADVDIHLVLTASMKPADVTRVAERFEIFRPANLLFTRLDETSAPGTVYTQAVHSGKPLSFLGTGQQIPEDLEPAAPERIVHFLLDPVRRACLAA